jgi:hypothetical protein
MPQQQSTAYQGHRPVQFQIQTSAAGNQARLEAENDFRNDCKKPAPAPNSFGCQA